MDNAQQAIGGRIREARRAADLKQHEIAASINMSLSNYQKVESGQIGVSGVVLSKLSRLLNTSADFLINTSLAEGTDPNTLHEPAAVYAKSFQIENLLNKVDLLEQLLADKEEIIRLLKDKVARYESQ